MGLDPIYIANEGAFVCIVDKEIAKEVLSILQSENPNASKIGFVTTEHLSKIIMESAFGGKAGGQSFNWRTTTKDLLIIRLL